MSEKDTQRERSGGGDSGEEFDDSAVGDSSFGGSGGRDRATVSNRSSWLGLTKRAYNVTGGGGSTDTAGAAKLGAAMVAGALLTWILPIPLIWLVGLGAGAAVAGRYGEGTVGVAGLVGAVIGLIIGLGFATALFGLGIVLTLVTTVLGAAIGGIGHLAGQIVGK